MNHDPSNDNCPRNADPRNECCGCADDSTARELNDLWKQILDLDLSTIVAEGRTPAEIAADYRAMRRALGWAMDRIGERHARIAPNAPQLGDLPRRRAPRL